MNGYQNIIELLKKRKIQFQEYTHGDISTFEKGKENTDFDINKIVKTLTFKIDNKVILVSLLGKSKLDYKKLADTLEINRSQIKMLDSIEIEKICI